MAARSWGRKVHVLVSRDEESVSGVTFSDDEGGKLTLVFFFSPSDTQAAAAVAAAAVGQEKVHLSHQRIRKRIEGGSKKAPAIV